VHRVTQWLRDRSRGPRGWARGPWAPSRVSRGGARGPWGRSRSHWVTRYTALPNRSARVVRGPGPRTLDSPNLGKPVLDPRGGGGVTVVVHSGGSSEEERAGSSRWGHSPQPSPPSPSLSSPCPSRGAGRFGPPSLTHQVRDPAPAMVWGPGGLPSSPESVAKPLTI
jgi:hypothetical protein